MMVYTVTSSSSTPLLSQPAGPQWPVRQAMALLAGCTAAALVCLPHGPTAGIWLSMLPPTQQTRLSGPQVLHPPSRSSAGPRPAVVAAVGSRLQEEASHTSAALVTHLPSQQPALRQGQGSPRAARWEPIRGMLDALGRTMLVVAALTVALVEWKPRRLGNWAMASTVEPKDQRTATLKHLEGLLDAPEETKSTLTEVASETLKKMYEVVDSKAVQVGDSPKSTLASLEALLGAEEPAALPTSAPKQDLPVAPQGPTPVSDSTTAEKTTASRPLEIRLPISAVMDEATLRGLQGRIPPEDVQRMKDVLAASAFRLTLAEDAFEFPRTGFIGGTLFRGQTSSNVDEVVRDVQQRAKQTFGDMYHLLVIPEPPRYDSLYLTGNPEEPMPAFLLVSATETSERPLSAFQYGLAALLALGTVGTAAFIAFGTGLTHLPEEEVKALFLATDLDGIAEVLQRNVGDILSAALPVGLGVLGTTAARELARRLVAKQYGVQLGLPYLLPNTDLGSLGAITRLRGMAPSKTALFDIAAAGPLAGAAASLLLFLAGLFLTSAAPAGDPGLVPMPLPLFQTSFLLGGFLKGLSGGAALQLHPLVLAGWCGLVGSALSALPIGTTDGGRIMQLVVGAGRKQVASLLVLLGLAFNALAPGVGNSWGLLAAFFMSGNERKVSDQFTPLDPLRRNLGAALILLSVLLLLPFPRS